MLTQKQVEQVQARAQCLYSRAEVEQALDRLASEISDKLAGHDPILLCVLNGALIPMGHLLTRLDFPLRYDYIHATRYQGGTSGSRLEWIVKPRTSLVGETVLVVDDILDEGVTLAGIVDACREAGAITVHTAVLVEKRHARSNGMIADFVGLEVDDRYVFGFGMDYKGYLRNAAGIYAVNET